MKNLIFKIFGFLIVFSMLMTSCKEEEITLNGARLSPKSIIVYENAAPQKIYLYLYPTKATQTGLHWETTDENIITVSKDGMVSPVGPGDAYVVIYQGARALDSCEVTVNPIIHVQTISLSPETLEIPIGSATQTLTVNMTPDNVTYPGIQWSSSDSAIVKVSSGGAITPVSLGTAIITATTDDGGLTAQCEVTVTNGEVIPDNLLGNPGFEDNDPVSPDPTSITYVKPWTPMTATELTQDDPGLPGSPMPSNSNYRLPPGDAFYTNNPTFVPVGVHGGLNCGRLAATSNAGLYQEVPVTEGRTYVFTAYILHFLTAPATQTVKQEYVRIKTAGGATELARFAIGMDNNLWMEVTGTYTVPVGSGITSVRFQISHHTGTPNTGATLIDDCVFKQQ